MLFRSFTESAIAKIKAAGGTTQVLQLPTESSGVAVGVSKKGAPKKSADGSSESTSRADD